MPSGNRQQLQHSKAPARALPRRGAAPQRTSVESSLEIEAGNQTVGELIATAQNPTLPVDPVPPGPGQPLDPMIRADMESRFGEALDTVRVHDDSQAAGAAEKRLAQAFTVGEHIVFGSGRFAPTNVEGRRLLAHELTHVIQQRHGGSPSSAAHEHDADRSSNAVAAGQLATVTQGAQIGVACKPLTPVEIWTLETYKLEARLAEVNREFFGFNLDVAAERDMILNELTSRRKKEQQKKADKKKLEGAKLVFRGEEGLNRAELEHRRREQHKLYKSIFGGEDVLGFEKDPEYWRAMGKYKAAEKVESAAVPEATPGVSAPVVIKPFGKPIKMGEDPEYWNTPRGQAHKALAERIGKTRSQLDSMLQDRVVWIEGSLVIRKASEGMVGINPPPREQLTKALGILDKAVAALDDGKVEAASKLYAQADTIEQEASWYWTRYKDLLEVGAERVINVLETIEDTAKYTLVILSMGGGGAVLAAGVGGGAAIETTEAVGKASLGEKINWTQFALERVVDAVLAKWGGRLAGGITAQIMKLPGFSEFESQAVSAAVTGVLSGMGARALDHLVRSLTEKDLTWSEFIDGLVAAIMNPSAIGYDVFLSQVSHALGPKAAKPSESTPEGAPSTKTSPPPKKPTPRKQQAQKSADQSADRPPDKKPRQTQQAHKSTEKSDRPPEKKPRPAPRLPKGANVPPPPPPGHSESRKAAQNRVERDRQAFEKGGGTVTRLQPGGAGGEQQVKPRQKADLPEGTHRSFKPKDQGSATQKTTPRKKSDKKRDDSGKGKKRERGKGQQRGGRGKGKQGQATRGKTPKGQTSAKKPPAKKARKPRARPQRQGAQKGAGTKHNVQARIKRGGGMVIVADVGASKSRRDLEKLLLPGVKVDLKGWHRAHSRGAGLGKEFRLGILYAPPRVNLSVQKRVENRVRELFEAANKQGITMRLTTETFAHPNSARLKTITYRVEAIQGKQSELKFEASVSVDDLTPKTPKRTHRGEDILDPRVETDITFPTQ